MTQNSIGVAVIGAGMVGRAHAAGYRVASQLYDLDLPEIRLVAVAVHSWLERTHAYNS